MNWKKLILAAVLIFGAMIITEFIIHVGILGSCYEPREEKGIFRPESDIMGYIWVKLIIGAVYSFFFMFIFVKGYEGRGLMEGIRYGIYITLFFNFTMAFMQYVLYGIPYSIVWSWIISGLIQNVIFGTIAALIYKPETAAA